MSTRGMGTRSSPITVVDSEEEVLTQLFNKNTSSNSSLSPPDPHSSELHQQGASSKKRKRANTSTAQDPTPLETRLSNTTTGESKRARKRKRKLERESREAAVMLMQNYTQVLTNTYTQPMPVPNDELELQQDPDPLPAYLPGQYYDVDVDMQPLQPPMPSTSSWVSSMAMAAAGYPPQHLELPVAPLPAPVWPVQPVQPITIPPPLPPLPPLPTKPFVNIPTGPKKTMPPKPPPASLIIGMRPDPDPTSKHGVFTFPAKSQADSTNPAPAYIPNPARTLVLEQLPKSHRNPDWVKAWCKSACGSHPVHVSVDGPQGKALVEFATAELARKAWGSPRLGMAYAGLKPHQLKGKPREDIIKAWWYRVDGVGAGAGVGEIEEGEIEGEEDKQPNLANAKESKKERKARRAREREEKKAKLEAAMTEKQAIVAPVVDTHQLTPAVGPSVPLEHPLPGKAPAVPSGSGLPSAPVRSFPSLPQNFMPHYPHLPLPPAGYTAPLHPSLPTRPTTHMKVNPPQLPPAPPQPSATDGEDMDVDDDSQSPRTVLPPSLPAPPMPELANSIPSTLPKKVVPWTSTTQPANRQAQLPPKPVSSLPVEPRAMKNAPTGPSHAKRALLARHNILARHQALEERIAKCKIELEMAEAGRHPPPPVESFDGYVKPVPTPPLPPDAAFYPYNAPPPRPPSPTIRPAAAISPVDEDAADKQAMEDRLRMLVLQSQRSKVKPVSLPKNTSSGDTPLLLVTSIASESITGSGESGNTTLIQPTSAPVRSVSQPKNTSSGDTPLLPVTYIASESIPGSSESGNTTLNQNTSSGHAPLLPLTSTASESISGSSESGNTTPSIPAPTEKFSFEDLAVSFITQTIETVKSQSTQHPIKHNSYSNTKLELAAKTKRLEQHIAESKMLMAQLTATQSKPERDRILAIMRDKSRLMEEEEKQSNAMDSAQPLGGTPGAKPINSQGPVRIRWPDTNRDFGMLILSDDESDEESD